MGRHGTKRAIRRGFTLTEMLIVLGILVALAAMVVPRFLGTQKKADLQTAETQIGLFRGALESYALHTKGFPSTEQGLEALIRPPAEEEGGEDSSSVRGWAGPYLDKEDLPTDPWGNGYQYAYPPDNGTMDFPDIWSAGPDGEDGTEDDICSWGSGAREGGEDEFGREPDEDLDVDIDVDVGGSAPSGPDEF